MANLYSVPLKNSVQHTLAGTLTVAETGTITLDSSVVLELQASSTMKGLLVVDRVDVNGNLTPTKCEYIAYTGVSGSTVTGLTRGLSGTTAQGHAIGAVVEFVPDVTWAQAINDVITNQHNSDGTHKTLALISLASVNIINSSIRLNSLSSNAITYSSLQNITLDGVSQYNSSIFAPSIASATIQNSISGANVQKVSYISTASTVINLDLSLSNVFDVTVGTNKTINFNNAIGNASLSQFFIVRLYYTGSFSGTWANTIRWSNNLTPTQTSSNGKADEFGFKALSPTVFEGFIVGQNHTD